MKFVAKRFDISTLKGLRSANRCKARLENKYWRVNVRLVGVDKIEIEGVDKE
jgi:hypothetical protein